MTTGRINQVSNKGSFIAETPDGWGGTPQAAPGYTKTTPMGPVRRNEATTRKDRIRSFFFTWYSSVIMIQKK